MNIVIPAKTFLVGEYLALTGGPSIILTTTPCFELRQCNNLGLHGVHPEYTNEHEPQFLLILS